MCDPAGKPGGALTVPDRTTVRTPSPVKGRASLGFLFARHSGVVPPNGRASWMCTYTRHRPPATQPAMGDARVGCDYCGAPRRHGAVACRYCGRSLVVG